MDHSPLTSFLQGQATTMAQSNVCYERLLSSTTKNPFRAIHHIQELREYGNSDKYSSFYINSPSLIGT